jgi:hypothetical protein
MKNKVTTKKKEERNEAKKVQRTDAKTENRRGEGSREK